MMIPATRTARKPEPCATVAAPKMTRTPARTRGEYRPSLGSGTRRMNASRARPPATPTATPTAICSANSAATCQATLPAPPWAASSAASRAMVTGSLAPDSPSSSTPVRPAISRRPNTENTTAGSVAATAVPTSRARCQLMPATYRAATAVPAAVTSVPATPTQTMGAAAVRKRRMPMCMPPSNRMIASASVTTWFTVDVGRARAPGHSCAATTAATRKNAGAGTRSLALSRLLSTAALPARPITSTTRPNWVAPLIAAVSPAHLAARVRCHSTIISPRTARVPWGRPSTSHGIRWPGQALLENWPKLNVPAGMTIVDTLNVFFSRPNWYITSATRWIRPWSMPIG